VDDEPASNHAPRVVRSIQALLSQKAESAAPQGLRARTPGTTKFLDLLVIGDEHRFVERTIRINKLSAGEAQAARAVILAAIPARTGRVT
jgi:hypothetical protein